MVKTAYFFKIILCNINKNPYQALLLFYQLFSVKQSKKAKYTYATPLYIKTDNIYGQNNEKIFEMKIQKSITTKIM